MSIITLARNQLMNTYANTGINASSALVKLGTRVYNPVDIGWISIYVHHKPTYAIVKRAAVVDVLVDVYHKNRYYNLIDVLPTLDLEESRRMLNIERAKLLNKQSSSTHSNEKLKLLIYGKYIAQFGPNDDGPTVAFNETTCLIPTTCELIRAITSLTKKTSDYEVAHYDPDCID